MVRSVVYIFSVLSFFLLLACVPKPCKEGCETNMWPRIIVGVIPQENITLDIHELLQIRIMLGDGTIYEGHREGCPKLPEDIICTVSFFTAPKDKFATILVKMTDRKDVELQSKIRLGEFNYCGRDIAYVPVTLSQELMPHIGAAQLVSPCEIMTD